MASSKCPVCGTPVRTENLAKHLASVHPREATSQMVKEAKQAGEETVKATKPRTRTLRTRPSWRVPVAVLVIVLVAGGAYVVATNPVGQYNANTPVLEMCVNSQHVGMVRHDHAYLNISFSGTHQPINQLIGITSACTRPLHTHDATGVIHIESPVPHEFTLSDFFLVWNKVFSADQILDRQAGSGHTITMTVNTVPNYEFGALRLQNGQYIDIYWQ